MLYCLISDITYTLYTSIDFFQNQDFHMHSYLSSASLYAHTHIPPVVHLDLKPSNIIGKLVLHYNNIMDVL